jgi:Putative Actinobacterial Holin-X, holin superfamily III
MSNEPRSPAEPSTTSLLGGIISDFGNLIKQEIRFAKAEFKSDLGKTREAATALGLGVGVASLSGLLLVWMLVHLLHWATSPADMDKATLPLWACFGIVGLVFGVIGGVLVMSGIRKFQSFNPLPDETAQSIKENVKWIANSK